MRVAVGFAGVRPLIQSIRVSDRGSTGAIEMSTFHQLLRGNTRRDEKSSRRVTLSPAAGPGPGPLGAGPVGESSEQPASVSAPAAITVAIRA
jgi:hypothetical protein